jgi:hypothetical protein
MCEKERLLRELFKTVERKTNGWKCKMETLTKN